MNKLKAVIMAAAILLPTVPAQAAPIKYKDFFEYNWRVQQCWGIRVFDCDYTSKTCLSGFSQFPDQFAGVVLAEDRQTVLAHIVGMSGTWYNADTGVVKDHGMIINVKPWHIDPDQLEKRRLHECGGWGNRVYEEVPK